MGSDGGLEGKNNQTLSFDRMISSAWGLNSLLPPLQRARLWTGGTITPSPGFAVGRECQALQTAASTPFLTKVKPAQPTPNHAQSSVQALGLVWSPDPATFLGCKGAHLWEQREGQREAVKMGKSGPESVWLTDRTPQAIGKENQEPWMAELQLWLPHVQGVQSWASGPLSLRPNITVWN